MTDPAAEEEARVPTSVILQELLRDAPGDRITLEWLLGRLGERSFGIVLLLIALVGLVPGVSAVAGILLALPAAQMLRAHQGPVLPRWIAARGLPTCGLARLIERTVPVMRRLERIVRPRWVTPFEATKRVLGLVILLLSATLLAPIPFSQFIPIFVIMLLAFAFLERDGILLCIALLGAALSFALTVAAVWGTVEIGLLL
ncbi:MAG: exopolysaccharide biosynthesis protein [Alphaproteobacteria bacterium]|nr:exopolysaccharide biosynthesis protein [Alphaproteobacteria bacterium]